MTPSRYHLELGLDIRRGISGANLYVKIFQLIALLPLPYIFAISVYPDIIRSHSVLSLLFDLGMAASPRLEALALSNIYRTTASECIVYFALIIIALILGILAGNVLTGGVKISRVFHLFAAIMISADLIIRLIPVHANLTFGLPAQVFGFLIRSACLILVISDLKAHKKSGA